MKGIIVYTIGHSNRELDEFIKLIKHYKIDSLIDVRRFPSSKIVPHFNRQFLENKLKENSVRYLWLGDQLGGFRKPSYVSYMETESWKEGYKRLKSIIENSTPVIMCKEKLWFKCHRRFIANELVKEGYIVIHIIDKNKIYKHKLQLNL